MLIAYFKATYKKVIIAALYILKESQVVLLSAKNKVF